VLVGDGAAVVSIVAVGVNDGRGVIVGVGVSVANAAASGFFPPEITIMMITKPNNARKPDMTPIKNGFIFGFGFFPNVYITPFCVSFSLILFPVCFCYVLNAL